MSFNSEACTSSEFSKIFSCPENFQRPVQQTAMTVNIFNNNNNLYFLIDSGSDVSLIQKHCIRGNIHCNPE